MQCANCGAEVREGVPFCSECGRPLRPGEKQPKPKKQPKAANKAVPVPEAAEQPKKKKIKWKLVLFLVILAVVLGAAGYGYLRLPAFRMQRALNAGDAAGYQNAAKIYSAEVKDSFLQKWFTSMLCKDQMGQAAEAYFAGDLTYDEAKAFYTAFTAEGSKKLSREAKKQLEAIEADHTARETLAAGDAALDDGDYETAMAAYAKVPKDSAVYSEAQKKLSEAREAYVTSICDRVDKLVGSGSYAKAMTTLNDALELLPDDEKLTAKRATVGTAFEAITLDQVSDLLAEEDYGEALDQLAHALEVMPESKKLADKLDAVEAERKAAEKAKESEDAEEAEDDASTRSISTQKP